MKKTNLTDKQKKRLEDKAYKKITKRLEKGGMSNKKLDKFLKKTTICFEPTTKAIRATVESVDTSTKTAVIRLSFDASTITLPYNPQIEDYLTSGTVQGKTVFIWYSQSVSNGIVMQSGDWGL